MTALELDRVWKRYALGARRSFAGQLLRHTREATEVWALRDLSLTVEAGESVGVVGHNGAGKTTALKLLAGITRPTQGQVRTSGRVASLINLGAGFHPDLTGRENIFLNGVILGLSRREVKQRFEAIVEFADIGAFIDTPLKRYSSGMHARLGFAVAAHVDPDVLLVDEVLSVGDVAFQDRSIRKMLSFRDTGKAILFVSHNLSAVEMMCQRTVWLDHGVIRKTGPTGEVVRAYLNAVDEALLHDAAGRHGVDEDSVDALEVTDVRFYEGTHNGTHDPPTPRADFEYGEAMRVKARFLARHDVKQVQCSLTIRGDYGPLFTANSETFDCWRAGPHELDCIFATLPLLPGLYRSDVQVRHADTLDWAPPRRMGAFRVSTDLAAFGSESVVGATKSRGGFLAVAYDWRLRSPAGEQRLRGLRLPSASKR